MNSQFSPEQVKAITVEGGAIISAGAGSGKTAVLIEHIMHWISQLPAYSASDDEMLIQQLRQLHVVTFTVKASQEMRLRLSERLLQEEGKNENTNWKTVRNNIAKIFIGTIDGFCANLIKQNKNKLSVNTSLEIVSEQEWDKKIQDLFWLWHAQENSQEDKKLSKIWASKIINWLIKVFGSTQQRIKWVNQFQQKMSDIDFININEQDYIDLINIFEFTKTISNVVENFKTLDVQKVSDKKWFEYLKNFSNIQTDGLDLNTLKKLIRINKEFKVVMGPRGEELAGVNQSITQLRKFFTQVKEIEENWQKCLESKGAKEWESFYKIISKVTCYIEKNYSKIKGLCFSDLAYYSLEVINHQDFQVNEYSYVVIDELQDTSRLQLSLLLKYVGNNASRLYGVGDIKQAIYGFRGGEAHVFFEFENIVKQRINLFDNFRSHASIVEFNNNLFAHLFDKTRSLPQVPKADVEAIEDIVPVEILKWEISDDEKIEEWQQETLEYHALILKIKKIINLDKNGSISVLFKTNGQIKKFSSLLSQEDITFSVQWKVKFFEDPQFQLFKTLLHIGEIKNKKIDSHHLEKILAYYYRSIGGECEIVIKDFFAEWCMFDPYTCFVRWMHQHKIVMASQAPFLKLLKERASSSNQTFKEYLLWMEEIKNDDCLCYWTLPECNNEHKTLVLQTIHASKGLQYDHVLLARISMGNEKSRQDDIIFDLENPCAYKQMTFLKTAWKSPSWFKSQHLRKNLQKEESIRLFYVAATRARKSLTMSIAENKKTDSWGDLVCKADVKHITQTTLQLDHKAKDILGQELRMLPIYEAQIFKNWRKGFLKDVNTSALKLAPSLSVTSLMVYERCPMKYYFENILGLEKLEINNITQGDKSHHYSSSERGTFIHSHLQKYFNKDESFDEALSLIDGEAKKMFLQLGQSWREKVLQSDSFGVEQEIRFLWSNSIILGTPDIYLTNENSSEIWDFKTGTVDEEDKDTYFLQLTWYAFALYQNNLIKKDVVLKIIALDDQVIHEKRLEITQIESILQQWWKGFFYYHTKKLNHCSKCSYQLYCNK